MNNFMIWFIDNWYVVFLFVLLIVSIIFNWNKWFSLSKEEQIKNLKEWLLYAVMLAESHYGSGTGKLKLREVYDKFVSQFPWLAKVITFEYFSTLVDEALEEMKKILNENNRIEELIVWRE